MLSEEVHDKICASVDSLRDELLHLVSDLIRIPSVEPNFHVEPEQSDGESKVTAHMEKVMREIGLTIDRWEEEPGRANLVGVWKGTGGGRSLLFNGHVDTVPGDDPAKWPFNDPWSGKIDGEKIWGRGSTDMKSGNAAAAIALKALLKAGYHPRGDVILENVVGEENMSTDAGTGAVLKRGYKAEAAIVCEPTSFAGYKLGLCPAGPGVLVMSCTIRGKAVHCCMRDELIRAGGSGSAVGVSAIDKGFIVYQALRELEHQWGQSKAHPAFKRPGHFTISVGSIHGGQHDSFVPDSMTLNASFFYPPQFSTESIKREVEEFIKSYTAYDPWLRENPPQCEWCFSWPGFEVPNDSPICNVLSAVAKSVDARYGELYGMYSVCDAAFIHAAGIPCVCLGPGNLGVAHSIGEHVLIEEVIGAAKIYALTIAEWCGI